MSKKSSEKLNLNYLIAVFFNSLFILSFEIIATRITSVIFVYNYVFIIISLAVLGLTCGSIFVFYRFKANTAVSIKKWIISSFIFQIFSLLIFILIFIRFKLTSNIYLYFLILSFPFFFVVIINSIIFKSFSKNSFLIYAFDLIGASSGAFLSVLFLNEMGGPNGLLFSILIIFIPMELFILNNWKEVLVTYFVIGILATFLFINGQRVLIGEVQIGKFPEKDFYYAYPGEHVYREIIESRWSIYGRSDLVRYSHQNLLMHLFVDGAAGTRMYNFDGNITNPNPELINLLFSHSTAMPILLSQENQRDNMLVIGPGGGKEVLIGLLNRVKKIDCVEINPDFVEIVKDYSDYNGGIYSYFPNVNIYITEGRHYVKRVGKKYDIIVIALPSTEQAQNIEVYAANENFLLTKEAIKDYFKIASEEGMLIFTLHSEHEVLRIITSLAEVFKEFGISTRYIPYYISIIKGFDAPTVVVKKKPFSKTEADMWVENRRIYPNYFANFIYLPYYGGDVKSIYFKLLEGLKEGRIYLKSFIENYKYNILPCNDDKPYFYNIEKNIPEDLKLLLISVSIFNLLLVVIPIVFLKLGSLKNSSSAHKSVYWDVLVIFISLGAGFMLLELSLFQKLILFLGSPTISLVILLAALLISMGIGSYCNEKLFKMGYGKRISIASLIIVLYGVLLSTFIIPMIYSMIKLPLILRILMIFTLVFPLGFLLGTPFPTAIRILNKRNQVGLIPWMYGINGGMSVFGSVLGMSISMVYGYAHAFIAGLCFYMIVFLLALVKKL